MDSPFVKTTVVRQAGLLTLLLTATWAAACGGGSDPAPVAGGEVADPRIAAVENGLLPRAPAAGEEGIRLADRMRHWGVPGVQIAVVESYEVAWARAYGVADRETGEPVTTATLFQAGSISKPVAATGVLAQVQAGRFGLDQPINTLLESWTLPENDLTRGTPVTVRHLLSHSGGTTVHGFPGYGAGYPVPTTVQVLDGAFPANTSPVRVDMPPGGQFRYSGGGTTILQLALEDSTGEPFPELLARTVLGPRGMEHSTYENPLPPARLSEAAAGHWVNGRVVPGKRHTYPEMAAAGLWTTAEDLARFGAGMQRELAGAEDGVLTPETARQMLETVHGQAALGFFVEERGGNVYFQHGGADEGFQALLVLSRDGGRGAAVMTNSDIGIPLAQEIVGGIARVYEWPGYLPEPVEEVALGAEELDRYLGRYKVRDDLILEVAREGERLAAHVTGLPPADLLAVGDHIFVAEDDGARIRFVLDDDGRVEGYVRVGAEPADLRPRLPDGEPAPVELFLAGNLDDALLAYREIGQKNPGRLNQLGFTALRRGDPAAGVAILELNVELHPQDANLWDSLGEGYLVIGETEKAREIFARLLAEMPQMTETAPELVDRLRNRARIEVERLGE